MPQLRVHIALLTAGLVALAAAAAQPEFNWIPSGEIDVGNRASEAAAEYEAQGEPQTVEVAYHGEVPQRVQGRLVQGDEKFVIRPASYRGGAAPAHLVISRTVDSENPPGRLIVLVEGNEVGVWNIVGRTGARRLYDARFVIPRSVFPNNQPPGEVHVTIRPEEPHLSLGYRFHATRDWDVLGVDCAGDLDAAVEAAGEEKRDYLQAVVMEGEHLWHSALDLYRKSAQAAQLRDDGTALARLSRSGARRCQLRIMRAAALAEEEQPRFETHYRLGLLAGALGVWDDARVEFELALQADPTHVDATYRLAEALEYCRRPIAEWAPIFERAGWLGADAHTNVEDVLVAIHPQAVEGMCGELSLESLRAIQRDWRYVEQQVFGASRGAWRLRTHYMIRRPGDPPWVMQAGWIFLPPDSAVPVEGTYDYSIGTAQAGFSHAGGVDCGVSGSGGANIGAQRSWEVFLHEWNHEFDWVCISAESVPGYPVTHDSDGCGKQPIVSMGCGHRSSMRYYINPAQYRRHEAADPVAADAFVSRWAVGAVVPAPAPPADAELSEWLVADGHFTAERIGQLQEEWTRQREAPPSANISAEPPRKPVPDWPEYLRAQWHRVSMIDQLAVEAEAALVAGASEDGLPVLQPVVSDGDFVDLAAVLPDAPAKAVAYARTYVHSPVDQEVRLWLGYNDCAQLWCNGRQVHKGRYYAVAKWEDLNRPYMLAKAVHLEAGWNCLAAKVERGGGDWGFGVHLVDFDNEPVAGLEYSAAPPADATVARYTPPTAGAHHAWNAVADDYLEKLPRLTSADLATITGIEGATISENRFLLLLPEGQPPLPGSRYAAQPADQDRELNNYLDWDTEAVAALRYERAGQVRDLLLVRPEYFTEFLTLLQEQRPEGVSSTPAERVLGYIFIEEPLYNSVPNVSARAVLVLDTYLGEYPRAGVDLLLGRQSGG